MFCLDWYKTGGTYCPHHEPIHGHELDCGLSPPWTGTRTWTNMRIAPFQANPARPLKKIKIAIRACIHEPSSPRMQALISPHTAVHGCPMLVDCHTYLLILLFLLLLPLLSTSFLLFLHCAFLFSFLFFIFEMLVCISITYVGIPVPSYQSNQDRYGSDKQMIILDKHYTKTSKNFQKMIFSLKPTHRSFQKMCSLFINQNFIIIRIKF